MVIIFQCVPVHANWTNWTYKVPPVKCINRFIAAYAAAGMSILHDVIILLMPIPILARLNLPWHKKLNVLVMFLVGSFVIICSIFRLPTLMKLKGSTDPSYDQAPIAIWTDLEVGVGIICGCLPSFRSLIGYMFPSLKMSLVPSYEGNTLVHWAGSRSKNKQNSAGLNTGVASFMELEDLHGSRHNLNQTKNEQRSVITRGSGASITE